MKGWFLWMSFVHPSKPPMPLAGEKFGEESKTNPSWQRESYRRSSLVSVGGFSDCALLWQPFGGAVFTKVLDHLWNRQLTKQSSPLQWPLLQEDTCGWCWKHRRDPSRVGVKVSYLSGAVKGPSAKLNFTTLAALLRLG